MRPCGSAAASTSPVTGSPGTRMGGSRVAAVLELRGVSKHYGRVVAVDAIDLRIAGGTYCCLLGPSGCGKTSTLRMIAGHETVTSGDIVFDGEPITDRPPGRRGTAMMFQSYALFPHLSVLDNVAFALKMRGIARERRRARAASLLELMAMEAYADRFPAQLSGGQQQRVALARGRITAIVTAVEYQGNVVHTDLRADDGTELVAVAADHLFDREPLEPGARVAVSWDDAGAHRLA